MRGTSKYIDSSSGKDIWPYRGWPLLRVETKRGATVSGVLSLKFDAFSVTMAAVHWR